MVPFEAIPIPEFVLVHAKVAPLGLETKVAGVIVVLGHTVIGLKGPMAATG